MPLKLTGERQISTDLDRIAPDHRKRYQFACSFIEDIDDVLISSILDAACGNGYGSHIMASRLGLDVVGIDISDDALDCAREAYDVPPYTSFVKCDLVEGDIPGEDYDVIVCFETLEHIAEPDAILRKFAAVGETLICSVPNEDVLPYEHAQFPFHFRHYTPEEFDNLLRENGWRPTAWYTQYSKQEGDVYEADDGRTLIVIAEKDDEAKPESP